MTPSNHDRVGVPFDAQLGLTASTGVLLNTMPKKVSCAGRPFLEQDRATLTPLEAGARDQVPLRSGSARPMASRRQRGASLIEALMAFALVTLSAVALLRIQITWTDAGRQSAQQTQAARGLQTGIDQLLSPAATLQTGSATIPGIANAAESGSAGSIVTWSRTLAAGAMPGEWSVSWSANLEDRGAASRTWAVIGHLYRIDPQVLARAEAIRHDPGAGMLQRIAPAGRQAALDPGFVSVPNPSSNHLPTAVDAPRPGAQPPLVPPPTDPSSRSACAVTTAAWVSDPSCDATRHFTRSGAIRWPVSLLADPAARASLEQWIVAVTDPFSAAGGTASGASPLRNERCAYRLEPGVDPHLAWRCLGEAWSPATSTPATSTSTTVPPPPIATTPLPSREPSSSDSLAPGITDPLGGLPAGLLACRFIDALPLQARLLSAPPAAVLQHQRVHWIVVRAVDGCPADTVRSTRSA